MHVEKVSKPWNNEKSFGSFGIYNVRRPRGVKVHS